MANSKEYFSLHGNKKCNECIIVLSDMLPEWAMYDNRRVIHIKHVNDIQRVLEYHKRGLIVKNWLKAIYISDEKFSFSMFNNFLIYKGLNISNIKSMLFHDLDGNVIFEFLSNPLIEDITFNYYLSVYKFLIRHNASNFCTSMAMLKARKSVKDQFSQEDIDSAIAFSLDLDLTSVVEIKRKSAENFVHHIVDESLFFSKEVTDPGSFIYFEGAINGNSDLNIRYLKRLRGMGRGDLWKFIPDITLLKSGTGSGKTDLALDVVIHAHRIGKKTSIISNLKSVIQSYEHRLQEKVSQLMVELEPCHIITSEAVLYEIEESKHIATTLKSLSKPHIIDSVISSDIIIIDEVEKVFEALYSKSNSYIDEREKSIVRELLQYSLNDPNTKLLLMDADITNKITKNVIKSLLNFERNVLLANAYNSCLEHDFGSIEVSLLNGSHEKQTIIDKIQNVNENCFVFSSSKDKVDVILKESGFISDDGNVDYISALDNQILVIVASKFLKEHHEEAVEEFIRSPNTEIFKYHTVICSPVLKEGFSIESNYTDTVYCLCDKVLTPKEIIQSSRRLRKAKKIRFGIFGLSTPITLDHNKYNNSPEDWIESSIEFRKKVLIDNFYDALKLTLAKLKFNIVEDSFDNLPSGIYGKKKNPHFDKDVLEIIMTGRTISQLSSAIEKTKLEAALLLRSILKVDLVQDFIVISSREEYKGKNFHGSFIGIDKELYNHRSIINHILPNKLKITERKDENIGQAKITRKIKNIFQSLGFNSKRIDSGKSYKFTYMEEDK
ncbi:MULTISPECIES: hypothetical protein [Vibrio]|uniref:hypothetical protein n=1 Tax=Vibrio TaxID=662 RepID=UPI0004265619|nr:MULTISPECIES: hypothetical protein [Vibrio]MDF4383527.1 hypothetical protein [Vibrio parahaemolyticus]MBO0206653.1 hypothetical protein [Vibrio sp. Vb0877]MBS9991588.1 hypothetical protein [Vibrio alginolyticus]MDW1665672.1 hypothetical protein [Vibrio sp. Vb2656]MDW1699661.1 hypothetical protein [Vibrio sp. Vb2657]